MPRGAVGGRFGQVGAASGPFTPADLPGCYLWLDASDAGSLTLDGDAVVAWADKSGSGFNAVQDITESRPTLTGTLGDLSAVSFDGSQWLEVAGSSSALKPFTYVAAVSVAAGASDRTMIGPSAPGGWQWRVGADEDRVQLIRSQQANVIDNGGTAPEDALAIMTLTYDGSGNWVSRINGTEITGTNDGTPAGGHIYIGGTHAGERFTGVIGEVVVCDVALSAPDIAEVEGYLAVKWAGPLVPPPSYIAGWSSYVDQSTSMTATVPTGTLAPDTVLLITKTDGTPPTQPDWTLVGRATQAASTVSVWRRTGLTGGETFTALPGSSWLSGVTVATLRDVNSITYAESYTNYTDTNETVWDGTTIAEDNTLLMAIPFAQWRTATDAAVMESATFTYPGVALFYKALNAGAFGPDTFTMNATGGNDVPVIELQIT